jgi:hypothetical protein
MRKSTTWVRNSEEIEMLKKKENENLNKSNEKFSEKYYQ